MYLYIYIFNVKILFLLIEWRVKFLYIVVEGFGRVFGLDKFENIFYIVKLMWND